VQEQAQEKVQEARGAVRQALAQQIDTRSNEIGSQLNDVTSALRRTTHSLRGDGKETPAKILDQLTDRSDRVGRYLSASDADTVLRDAENFGRRRPWVVIVGGVALGFVGSRFLKASSNRRFEQLNDQYRRPAAPAIAPGLQGVDFAYEPAPEMVTTR